VWQGLKIGIWPVMTGIFFSFDTSREQSPLLLFRLTMHAYFCLSIPLELLFYVNAFYFTINLFRCCSRE